MLVVFCYFGIFQFLYSRYTPIRVDTPPNSISEAPIAWGMMLPFASIYLSDRVDKPMAMKVTPKQMKRNGLLITPPLNICIRRQAK